jgi:hypothetical protein
MALDKYSSAAGSIMEDAVFLGWSLIVFSRVTGRSYLIDKRGSGTALFLGTYEHVLAKCNKRPVEV